MARQILRRKSDGKILNRDVEQWSGWQPDYSRPKEYTTNRVPYYQSQGVKLKVQELTLLFCDSYPNSTEANKDLLIELARRNADLLFKDSKGQEWTVLVDEEILPGDTARAPDIKTKDVYRTRVVIRKKAYEA